MRENATHSYWFLMEQGLNRLEDAKAVCQTVFVEEQGFRDESGEIDPIAHHLVVYVENIPVATGCVFPDTGGRYIIGRIATIRPCRDGGPGRIMMENLENQARALGAQTVILATRTQARGFYKSLDYQTDSEVFLEKHYPHIWVKKSWPSTESGADSPNDTQRTIQN